jgi:hypothetical protein
LQQNWSFLSKKNGDLTVTTRLLKNQLSRPPPGHPDQPQQAGADDISDILLADMLHVPQFANQ